MNIKKAISLAKGNDAKRVGFNLQIPVELKTKFEEFCKNNDVKVTAMILSLMEMALEEENENKYHEVRSDIEKIEVARKKVTGNELSDEQKNEFLELKGNFENYILKYGEYIPSTNSYNVESLIDIGNYLLLATAILDLNEKEK